MTITITGNLHADEKTRKYVEKVIGSLEKYLSKSDRDSATADVVLRRVNRIHGNKYEANVIIHTGSKTFEATDSTLNVFAAIDIVRRKLAIELRSIKKAANSTKLTRLPQSGNSV